MSTYDSADEGFVVRPGRVEARVESRRVLRRLGQAIRIERANARVRLEDLSAWAGLSPSTLSRFERGDRAPRFDQLFAIAAAMDISVFRLIEGADDRECSRCEKGRSAHVLVCRDAGFHARLGGRTTPALERGY